MISKYLTTYELKGFSKLADCLVPGDGELPAFSKTNFINFVDLVLEEVSEPDLKDLKMLFAVLAILPKFLITFFLYFIEVAQVGPDFWRGNLRKIEIGLKGIIYSLYYSRLPGENRHGDKIFEVIGWETNIPGLTNFDSSKRERELGNGGQRPSQFI